MVLARLISVVAFAVSSCAATEIRIVEGPAQEQVLQRDLEGYASISLKGTVAAKKSNGKAIEVRLTGPAGVLAGFDWRAVAVVQKTSWAADLGHIPAGGPYRLEVRLEGSTAPAAVDNLLVGDLWVLAGQSNMEGLGDLVDVQQPDPLVHSFDMSDRWEVAEEPLHTTVNAVDRVHWRRNPQGESERLTGDWLLKYQQERKKGAGLGLPFAVAMVRRTGIPIGLIPCAHFGTSMEQWSPDLKEQGGDSLYGSMYRRFRAVGGRVRGMLWFQGESDANPKAAPEFHHRFLEFVKSVRADFKDPDLPFYYVQIGRHINGQNIAEWNQIQEAQRLAEAEIANCGMAVSIDLAMEDGIHLSTPELKRLARRLADHVSHDLFPRVNSYGELKLGPRPVSAILEHGVIRVRFSGVNERLESEGRISGFTIHDSEGQPVPLIFRAAVDPAEASTVLLYLAGRPPEKAFVRYGFGKDPYCNLHDTNDFAAPAFGPLPVKQNASPTG